MILQFFSVHGFVDLSFLCYPKRVLENKLTELVLTYGSSLRVLVSAQMCVNECINVRASECLCGINCVCEWVYRYV